MEYQQQVQSHPGMMLVTALNKQYHAKNLNISYNNSRQIYSFDISPKGIDVQKHNLDLTTKFVSEISNYSEPALRNNNVIFSDISASLIKTLFNHLSQ